MASSSKPSKDEEPQYVATNSFETEFTVAESNKLPVPAVAAGLETEKQLVGNETGIENSQITVATPPLVIPRE